MLSWLVMRYHIILFQKGVDSKAYPELLFILQYKHNKLFLQDILFVSMKLQYIPENYASAIHFLFFDAM